MTERSRVSREPSAISIADFNSYADTIEDFAPPLVLDDVAQDWARGHIPVDGIPLRPGGYVPGPTMMGAVDFLGWVLVFTRLGITPMAVTWDLKINFLRPAVNADVIIEATQTKFGTYTHATYDLWLDGRPDKLVAHATTTYAIPRSE